MPKRKSVRKQQRPKPAPKTQSIPVPALALKVLAVILSIILIIALTLYVTGKMASMSFWILAALLAIIGFVVMPAIRKRYVEQDG